VADLNNRYWKSCPRCLGRGKRSIGISKKAKERYMQQLEQFKTDPEKIQKPSPPQGILKTCKSCNGTGIVLADRFPKPDSKRFPHVAIIGAGIGGTALAVACLHRGIPFKVYERDASFNDRSQGYGLTLQQASKAMADFGISHLEHGLVSSRHLVFDTDGNQVAEWGMRKWLKAENPTTSKTNIHIARQSLRSALLNQLLDHSIINWNHKLIDYQKTDNGQLDLRFEANGKTVHQTADLIVGADGIRSTVRKLMLGSDDQPLRYLDCMVILGICPLDAIENSTSGLLDNASVFQTANGHERMYMMPYSQNVIMWQFSFPITESKAKALTQFGSSTLKIEALQRIKNWHDPIPQILNATDKGLISGYPVYDRDVASYSAFIKQSEKEVYAEHSRITKVENTTIIGDAAHPMSPFKGQGANQALLDALALARAISDGCQSIPNWRQQGLRTTILNDFECGMMHRTAVKVKDSADAAKFLHSKIALDSSDQPRGNVARER
jgi:2-polyprenyl-6-methoxyphenol hydroxylase-like FAD-dependent oxidoreductase